MASFDETCPLRLFNLRESHGVVLVVQSTKLAFAVKRMLSRCQMPGRATSPAPRLDGLPVLLHHGVVLRLGHSLSPVLREHRAPRGLTCGSATPVRLSSSRATPVRLSSSRARLVTTDSRRDKCA